MSVRRLSLRGARPRGAGDRVHGAERCAGTDIVPTAATTSTTTTIPQTPTGRVVVLAATPIAATLQLLGNSFTAANPGVEVAVTSGSANGLVNQVSGGLTGDVFVSVGDGAVDQLAVDGHLASHRSSSPPTRSC